jgi:hypothetical protein
LIYMFPILVCCTKKNLATLLSGVALLLTFCLESCRCKVRKMLKKCLRTTGPGDVKLVFGKYIHR